MTYLNLLILLMWAGYFNPLIYAYSSVNSEIRFIRQSNIAEFNCQEKTQQQIVKLTTDIIAKEHQIADDDLYIVNLTLRLKYTNQENFPILIYKDWKAVSHIWVSNTEKNIKEGLFEISTAFTVLPEGKPIDGVELKDFAVLSKDESYETTVAIPILVRHDSNAKVGGTITRGRHVLQMKVDSWIWNEKDSEQLQNRFGGCGKIITNSIVSESMSFVID